MPVRIAASRNRYKAKPQTIDGVRFASTREANRFCILKLMQKAGEISGLTPHPRFSLVVNGVLIGHYTADASYFQNGKQVAEEVKSSGTRKEAAYRFRVKVFQALNPGIVFREVMA